jgi:hypothetical protein
MLIGFSPLCTSKVLLLLVSQAYGGQPPWGFEPPVHIQGVLHRGEGFEKAIGRGLFLRLVPDDQGWEMEVGDQSDDFTGCVTPPFHGITARQIEGWHFRTDDNKAARPATEFLTPGINDKRWFDFALTAGDNRKACDNPDDFTRYASGRGWFAITAMTLGNLVPGQQAWIESMQFEAELSFTGALELWRLPGRYTVPGGYTGWVRVHFNEKGAPPSPKGGDRLLLTVPASGVLHTSTELRSDSRDAEYFFAGGAPILLSGIHQQIWNWLVVNAGDCGAYQTFFVGTKQQFESALKDKEGGPPLVPCAP